MLPLSAPIWIAGLWWLLFRGRYRALAFAWLITAALILAMNPRVYYLFPAFPMLMAAGAVQFERLWPALAWIKPVYCALMVLMGAMIAPTLLPLLPPETYIRYAAATHLEQPRIENHKLGPLPQLFADQFGWEDMAVAVARVYNGLPADIRAAHRHLRPELRPGRRHRSLRSPLRTPARHQRSPELLLLGPPRVHRRKHDRHGRPPRRPRNESSPPCEKVGRVEHPYAMPYNHIDIFYCRGLKLPLAEALAPGEELALTRPSSVLQQRIDRRLRNRLIHLARRAAARDRRRSSARRL